MKNVLVANVHLRLAFGKCFIILGYFYLQFTKRVSIVAVRTWYNPVLTFVLHMSNHFMARFPNFAAFVVTVYNFIITVLFVVLCDKSVYFTINHLKISHSQNEKKNLY